VEYILAKNFNSEKLGLLGLPAYDAAKALVGFYREAEGGGGGAARMALFPLDAVQGLQKQEAHVSTHYAARASAQTAVACLSALLHTRTWAHVCA
jgi:hypothetical protein